ncbi:lysophospholipid acyltransferase family protein [Streptomyces sp. NPDC058280]|uniref:lysophospholipid acyltransferase family protein n=1 Tax=Streptomyces sp. NPDC058280 TaxID=3346419 RepID=UPI0036E0CECD
MSAWLPTAPCTPQDCSGHHGPTAGLPAAVGRLLAGTALVLAGALLTPLVAPLGAAVRDRLTRRWARTVLRAFGLRVRVVGRPEPRRGTGVLVVANHISWLDIPLVAAVLPGRMLAKSEIRRWPVLGALAARGGTLFVERERLRALPGTVRTLSAALTAGSRVVVFPEGCTWCGRDQGRFTPAVFQAALDAGAAVRPVRITYRAADGRFSGAPSFVGDDTMPASLWRVVAAGGLTAEITVLPLIPAGTHTDRRALARAARAALGLPESPVAQSAVTEGATTRTAVTGSATTRTAFTGTAFTGTAVAQTAVASDSANRPASSVHQCVSSIPASASSARTPS